MKACWLCFLDLEHGFPRKYRLPLKHIQPNFNLFTKTCVIFTLIDQSRKRLVKRQLKMLSVVQRKKLYQITITQH